MSLPVLCMLPMFTCISSRPFVRPGRHGTTEPSPCPRLRWSATVPATATVQLTHQRVDDVPLLLGLLIKLRLPQLLDRHLIPHPHHQGLSQGWLITIWIAYILSHADHRKCSVRDWANGLRRTLESLTGETIRDVDFTDDRLSLVLRALSDTELWDRIETDLWGVTCEVYELPIERIRLDSTTSCGFHSLVPDGLMQRGHSKDH